MSLETNPMKTLFQRQVFVYVYGTALAAELAGRLFDWPTPWPWLTKPLLLLLLLGYFQTHFRAIPASAYSPRWKMLFSVALIFAWLGDVLLMFTSANPLFFVLGLASFLLMQLCYIVCFVHEQTIKWRLGVTELLFVLYGIGFFGYLWPHLGALRGPVVGYAVCITLMGVAAYQRRKHVEAVSFAKVLTGAVLFIASDSLIAYAKFLSDFSVSGFAIMLTYGLGQYLIVEGVLEANASRGVRAA
jgi:uncharacterized membrane protein YhhN